MIENLSSKEAIIIVSLFLILISIFTVFKIIFRSDSSHRKCLVFMLIALILFFTSELLYLFSISLLLKHSEFVIFFTRLLAYTSLFLAFTFNLKQCSIKKESYKK